MAEKETPEERRKRIQEEVAKASALRKETYFAEQTKAKEAAAEKLPPLPAPDAYVYNYAWRQEVGGTGGQYKLIKTPNPYYDPSTNEIVDPVTGERKPMVLSKIGGKTVKTSVKNPDGTTTITYTDGTTDIIPASNDSTGAYLGDGTKDNPLTKDGKPFTGTYNGKNYVGGILKVASSSSTLVNNATTSTSVTGFGPGSQGYEERKSAYDLLYQQFAKYGLQGLVTPLEGLIKEGVPASEFAIRLRETDAYQRRFSANKARINKGLAALSEAEYIGLEDQYQNIMRQYGIPESYYARGDMGRQEGFEKFIAGDVSAAELEDRIATAQNRVINAAPEVAASLRQFYPNITNGDILAYALDPEQALTNIKRKVTAAEIGAGAVMAGLNKITPDMTPEQIAAIRGRAEELARYGVTGEQARTGFQTVAEVAPRGSQLSQFYREPSYTQTTAEQEVFGLAGATEAARQRKKLTQLEQASFSGRAGATSGALARERAGGF